VTSQFITLTTVAACEHHFNGHLPDEPGSASCPLDSPSPFIPELRSFWDRPKLSMSTLIQSHQVFFGRSLCLIPSISNVIHCLIQCYLYVQQCPNPLDLVFLIIKLTGSNPNSSQFFNSLSFVQFNSTCPTIQYSFQYSSSSFRAHLHYHT